MYSNISNSNRMSTRRQRERQVKAMQAQAQLHNVAQLESESEGFWSPNSLAQSSSKLLGKYPGYAWLCQDFLQRPSNPSDLS
jgi:hypothetical protein